MFVNHCLFVRNIITKVSRRHYRGGEINGPCRPVGDPDNCIFHFYLSVDDQNPRGGALFAIQNVVPIRIKYIPNSQCNVLTVPLYCLICSFTHILIDMSLKVIEICQNSERNSELQTADVYVRFCT